MDDRELLEPAAKAAGLELNGASMKPMYMGEDGQWVLWNPLNDDGDALRLACNLGMDLSLWGTTITASKGPAYSEKFVFDNRAKSVRYAIVECAAQLGKRM